VTFTALGFQSTREELRRIIAEHVHESSSLPLPDSTSSASPLLPPEETARKSLDFNTFLEIVTQKMDEPAPRKELKTAFRIFGGEKDQPIGIEHLRAISDALGVRMTQEQLEEMLLQALPKETRDECLRGRRPVAAQVVTRQDFLALMKRTGQYYEPSALHPGT